MSDPVPAAAPAAADPRPSGTRILRAIHETKAKRAERYEGVNPAAAFWVGTIRNFLLGLPCAAFASILGYRGVLSLDKVLSARQAISPDATLHLKDFYIFLVPAGLALAAIGFLAPRQLETAARFLGLGGIVDRLPFLKPKSTAAEPAP